MSQLAHEAREKRILEADQSGYAIPWKEIVQWLFHDRLAIVLFIFNTILIWYFYSLYMGFAFWSPISLLLPSNFFSDETVDRKTGKGRFKASQESDELDDESNEAEKAVTGQLKTFLSSLFQHHKNRVSQTASSSDDPEKPFGFQS